MFLHHILQKTCRLFCFVAFFLIFFSFLFPFFPLFLWSGLFCCVLEPGTLALHLLYLDDLRLFGLLCFTVVCDHRMCISLGVLMSLGRKNGDDTHCKIAWCAGLHTLVFCPRAHYGWHCTICNITLLYELPVISLVVVTTELVSL